MSLEEAFRNKRVLITGAGKGIGRALAVKLSQIGANVFAISRTQTDLDSLLQECPIVTTIRVDLSDWDATKKAVESCGAVDVVLNVAGVGHEEPFLEITPKIFDEIININLKAVVNVSQTAANQMIKARKGGSIVNISSRLSSRSIQDCSIYSSSKAALDQLTRSMAFELGKNDIKVNSVNLGAVFSTMWSDTFKEGGTGRQSYDEFVERMTPRIPAAHSNKGNPFIPIEDVINTVLFTASNLTTMLTGAHIALDGGYTTN